ncbi:hypothetical protein VT06_10900 [Arsukibacterium sp. MJ3]|uniref:hypothetical protein n=1 Tax=Arsukibacterium sp. MJ3 TaxID=1632859 RepID=UPI000626F781|nr:hypothetical protein [Arsukibacterium sp. MJ3]KKO48592.1 hypothetical protein VT06_10900 [Arsukibacterium sp. MJ3]
MIKALKVIIICTGFTVALAANTFSISESTIEQQQLDNLYACGLWPACRDPDQQKPTDIPTPKPNGDTDAGKDKKDQAQLA